MTNLRIQLPLCATRFHHDFLIHRGPDFLLYRRVSNVRVLIDSVEALIID